jgi:hypothetical protein
MENIDKMVDFILSFKQKQIDPKYREYLKNVKCMTGPGIINIFNQTCAFISDSGCYLEVGTHRGSTLLGAALDNSKTMFYGVDNFAGHNMPQDCAPFATIKEGLEDAIKRLSTGNVKYFESGYQEFFDGRVDVEGRKIEVYLYDGDHGYEQTYDGLKRAIPCLANEAIVFLDDSANNDRDAVWGAAKQLMAEDARFSVVREFVPKEGEMHGDFWCGLLVLKFKGLNK